MSSQGKGDVATNILQPGVVCPALVIPILGRKYSLHRPGIMETLTNEGVYLRDHGVTEALTEFTNVTANPTTNIVPVMAGSCRIRDMKPAGHGNTKIMKCMTCMT